MLENIVKNIDFIGKIIIPSTGIFLTLVGGIAGYFFGIVRERNNIKWKENREALQCTYAYFDVLYHRMQENMPFTQLLWSQLEDLKYHKNFNIQNTELHKRIREILQKPLYDVHSKTYNSDIYNEILNEISELLPKIKKELD